MLDSDKSNVKDKTNCLEKDNMEQSHSVIKDVLNARTNDLHEKKNSNNERSPQKSRRRPKQK